MTGFRRLPVRVRLTAGFAVAIVCILVATGVALYVATAATLLDELDTGLRSRVATIEAALPGVLHLTAPTPGMVESHEAFAQVIRRDGSLYETSRDFPAALLTPDQARTIDRPVFFDRGLAGVASGARLLAVPITKGSQTYVVIVGSSLSDRADALHMIQRLFLIGGPVALALACAAGWIIAGVALRPIERMRRQASAISAAGRAQRLSLPEADDELSRLASTLNEMLDRIDDAARAERRFLDNASHELRTPLTALKTELDLARSRPRSAADLSAVVDSASEETDRLVRMANDLLLLARSHDGHVSIEREPTSIRDLLSASADLFATRASQAHLEIDLHAPSTRVMVDPRRLRQAIDNLLDNALRYATSRIELRGCVDTDLTTVTVIDDGPGFAPGIEHEAFTPFTRSRHPEVRTDGTEGAGLGLAIVRMVAEAHGGTATATNVPNGGLIVTLKLPDGENLDLSSRSSDTARNRGENRDIPPRPKTFPNFGQ